MLIKSELTELFERLGTPPAGQKLVLNARMEAPVREVASRGGNVVTVLASLKMARDIRTESRHIEFAVAVTKEHAKDVPEYYAQPCELKLSLVDESTGEIRKVDGWKTSCTADYFLPGAGPLSPDSIDRLNAALADEGALSFFELLEAPYGFSADLLNQA
ncbi:hypothetical protein [Caballeronia ptereochthonis]|uniref:Integrase catalytic region n=1 Tax=Caballeronia ptereochthonis TaxID=1777144 RepID=A0A158AU64_9BURK|nr:hypothetical protein [Caballeronia ptereochthonis]SAK60567.1 integrase catalytic region [Caballeronia ptereochthonis]